MLLLTRFPLPSLLSTLLLTILAAGLMNTASANAQDERLWANVPQLAVAAPSQATLHQADQSNQASLQAPWQFAVPIATHVTSNLAGIWQQAGNTQTWRLRLHAPGAKNLNLTFTEWQMPSSAELRVYQPNGSMLGPFTDVYNQQNQLWSPVLSGDTIWLELTVAVNEQPDVQFLLSRVNYGYKTLDPVTPSTNPTPTAPTVKAGACQVDVACPAGNDYPDQIRAVARMIVDGRFACTGTLLNNTSGDLTPYFLSARHCFEGEDQPFNANLAQTVTINWNFQRARCNGGNGSTAQSQSGATFRATWDDTDMLLLELLVMPTAFQPFYAGWDRRNINFNSTVVIHHPGGDEKSISTDNDSTLITGEFTNSQSDQTYLRVSWENGTTEGGSSGSALFSPNKLVVGGLLGGNSSCEFTNGLDWFGRIARSWHGGGTPNSRLRDWLDPQGTAPVALAGRNFDGTASSNNAPQSGPVLSAEDNTALNNNSPDDSTNTDDENNGGGGGAVSLTTILLMLITLIGLFLGNTQNRSQG